MAQLIAGMPNSVTYNEVLPDLHLGRADDTVNSGYQLVVAATNAARFLHASFGTAGVEVVQLPMLFLGRDVSAVAAEYPDSDVGPESFAWDDQRPLCNALRRIDAVLGQGGKVLVCCQQGKDRSALVMMAYLRAKYDIPKENVENLYNFVQSKRYIITLNGIPAYWRFIQHEFNMILAAQIMARGAPPPPQTLVANSVPLTPRRGGSSSSASAGAAVAAPVSPTTEQEELQRLMAVGMSLGEAKQALQTYCSAQVAADCTLSTPRPSETHREMLVDSPATKTRRLMGLTGLPEAEAQLRLDRSGCDVDRAANAFYDGER